MKNLESKLQTECVKWFDLQYRNYAYPVQVKERGKITVKTVSLLFAIPNGGNRSPITGAIMKGEGVRPGVADLFLSVPKHEYHGLYIEMKAGKGKQSPTQEIFESLVKQIGFKYVVCRSFDEFKSEIQSYLKD